MERTFWLSTLSPGVPMHCPGCGSLALCSVNDGEITNFLCAACWRCWHAELGYFHRVDPGTCPGCKAGEHCGRTQAPDAPGQAEAVPEEQAVTASQVS